MCVCVCVCVMYLCTCTLVKYIHCPQFTDILVHASFPNCIPSLTCISHTNGCITIETCYVQSVKTIQKLTLTHVSSVQLLTVLLYDKYEYWC